MTRLYAIALVILVAAAGTSGAVLNGQARRVETGFLDRGVTLGGTAYRFQVYVPAEYTPETAWPLLVDLHGGGAQGSDGIRQTAHFLADQIRLQRSRFPLVVVFPQAALGDTWSSTAMQRLIDAELDSALGEFHADPKRIYLSGYSMGGSGAFLAAAREPERFAALVVVAGSVPADHAALLARIRTLPLRLFHGANDELSPVAAARRLADELRVAGAAASYTEYAGVDHATSAVLTWADPGVIDWLLQQRRR